MKESNEQKDKLEVEVINDLKTIENLLREFDAIFVPPISSQIPDLEGYAKKIKTYGIVLLVREDGKYIGLAVLYANDVEKRISYLSQIAVKQGAQQSGIGTMLLKECIATAKSQRMETLKLEVASANNSAINFYLKHGFEYYGKASSDTQYMIKEI